MKQIDDEDEGVLPNDISTFKGVGERGRYYKRYCRHQGGRILSAEFAQRYADDLALHSALNEFLKLHDEPAIADPPDRDPVLTDEEKKPLCGPQEEFLEGTQTIVRTSLIINNREPFRKMGGRFLSEAMAQRFPDDASVNAALHEYLRMKRESA